MTTGGDPIRNLLDLTPANLHSAKFRPESVADALAALIGGLGVTAKDPIRQGMTGSAPPGVANTAQTSVTQTTPTESVGPVEGGTPAVNQPFGGGHPGIDLATPVGAHLLAAINGTVTVAGNSDPGGYGNEVEITGPDGLVVRYGHLSAISVKQGDQVTAGQAIGQSGGIAGAEGSGNSTGPHLHFEVRQNGQPVDPASILAGGTAIVGGGSASNPTPMSPEDIAGQVLNQVTNVLLRHPPGESTTAATASGQPDQPGAAGSTTGNFATDVLEGIGAPATAENVRAFNAWARAEGMDASTFNPLATTEGAPGSSSVNSVGVRKYASYADGVQATIRTLLNGNYSNIIAALRKGTDALAVADAIAASPWGTGGLVRKVLGG